MNGLILPDGYVPFRVLELCSNKLIDVPVPIVVDDNPAFLLGQNSNPLVWLSAPVKPDGRQWTYVVERGRSRSHAVDVSIDESSKSVSVKVGDKEVLHASQTGQDSAVVDLIDMRPLGLNVHGTAKSLNVGGMILTANTFRDLRAAVAIGGKQAGG